MLVNWAVSRRLGYEEISHPVLTQATSELLQRFTLCLFAIWCGTFVLSVLYSGGVPIGCSLTGDSRTYSDFGIPTVGGLSILLRSVATILALFLFLITRRKSWLGIWVVMMLACVFELSRSVLCMLSCKSLCTFLLLQRIKLRHVAFAFLILTPLLAAFVGLGSLRGIEMSATDFGIEQFGGLPPGLYWA